MLLDVVAGALADAKEGPISRVERDGPHRAYVFDRAGQIILLRVQAIAQRHSNVSDEELDSIIRAMEEDSER